MFVLVVVAVLVVESLQGEAPVGLLAAPASFGYVRVVFAHRLRLVDLQLGVEPLQLRLQTVHDRAVGENVGKREREGGERESTGRERKKSEKKKKQQQQLQQQQ